MPFAGSLGMNTVLMTSMWCQGQGLSYPVELQTSSEQGETQANEELSFLVLDTPGDLPAPLTPVLWVGGVIPSSHHLQRPLSPWGAMKKGTRWVVPRGPGWPELNKTLLGTTVCPEAQKDQGIQLWGGRPCEWTQLPTVAGPS